MKEITTNGITILLVEVPEDAKDFLISFLQGDPDLIYKDGDGYGFICTLPYDDCTILGKSTELSEEQLREILPIYEGYIRGYKVYTERPDLLTKDITESWLSLLEANGIVDRNPYIKPVVFNSMISNLEYRERLDQWQEAQSKVKHYLVLERI